MAALISAAASPTVSFFLFSAQLIVHGQLAPSVDSPLRLKGSMTSGANFFDILSQTGLFASQLVSVIRDKMFLEGVDYRRGDFENSTHLHQVWTESKTLRQELGTKAIERNSELSNIISKLLISDRSHSGLQGRNSDLVRVSSQAHQTHHLLNPNLLLLLHRSPARLLCLHLPQRPRLLPRLLLLSPNNPPLN